jgi:hypothetical protein
MSSDAVQKGVAIVAGIPPELKAAIGCADNLIERCTISFGNMDAAVIRVEMIPAASFTVIGKLLSTHDLMLVKRKDA